jgi:glutamine synthetase
VFSKPEELLTFISDTDVEVFDIRFCDLPGLMQHLTVPASTVTAESLEAGMAFDGSSVRGFQSIHESDMLLLPDIATARIDPFRKRRTLTMNFFVHDPLTLQPYSRDPRNIARKAEEYLASTGIADTAFFGPEAEFYVFDSVRFDSTVNGTSYHVDSEAGWWNTGKRRGGRQPGLQGTSSRAATSRWHPTTTTPTCATTWSGTSSTPDSRSSAPTTRWAPAARRRSTTSSTPCWPPRTS